MTDAGARAKQWDHRVRLAALLKVAERHLGRGRAAELLAFACLGLSEAQAAARLGIGPETVATHWQRLRKRLGARSRTEAVAIVLEREILRLRARKERRECKRGHP